MTNHVIPFRPRPGFVPAPSSPSRPSRTPSRPSRTPSRPSRTPSRPSRSSSWAVPAVRVGWDGLRGLEVAACSQCAESFTSTRPSEVDAWAATHRCDPELAALLASVTSGRAA